MNKIEALFYNLIYHLEIIYTLLALFKIVRNC